MCECELEGIVDGGAGQDGGIRLRKWWRNASIRLGNRNDLVYLFVLDFDLSYTALDDNA